MLQCPWLLKPCSNQEIVENCSDHACRALLQEPSSLAPVGTVEPCSSVLGWETLPQPSDRRLLLRSPLLSIAPGTVEHCSGRHFRALLQCPWLSSVAPTKRSLKHCSDHPCRAFLQVPLSPAPVGTAVTSQVLFSSSTLDFLPVIKRGTVQRLTLPGLTRPTI